MTYGEGWHNNHHAFQTSARHGLRWWEVDMTYWMVRLMALCGLAHAIKLPKLRSEPEDSGAHTLRPATRPQAPEAETEAEAGGDDEPELAAASR